MLKTVKISPREIQAIKNAAGDLESMGGDGHTDIETGEPIDNPWEGYAKLMERFLDRNNLNTEPNIAGKPEDVLKVFTPPFTFNGNSGMIYDSEGIAVMSVLLPLGLTNALGTELALDMANAFGRKVVEQLDQLIMGDL